MNACVHTYTKPQTSSTRNRGPGWRIHGSVEDTKLSTNKQHSLSLRKSTHEVPVIDLLTTNYYAARLVLNVSTNVRPLVNGICDE